MQKQNLGSTIGMKSGGREHPGQSKLRRGGVPARRTVKVPALRGRTTTDSSSPLLLLLGHHLNPTTPIPEDLLQRSQFQRTLGGETKSTEYS